MEQTGSRDGSSLSSSSSTNSSSLFLNLPVDLVLLFCKFLPSSSTLTLSLTYKTLYALITSQNVKLLGLRFGLDRSERQAFLLLLEKDLGHHRYYCQFCFALHRFSPGEGPTGRLTCNTSFCLSKNGIHISFHHVRLVMNRHFYGPPNGIPLDGFQIEFATNFGSIPVNEKWSTKIFQNELLLSCTRTLRGVGEPEKCLAELRNLPFQHQSSVCRHVSIASALSPLPDRVVQKQELFSCNWCFSDFETTVDRHWSEYGYDISRKKVCWTITLTSYHCLGKGRPSFPCDEAKWYAFTGWYTGDISRDMQCPTLREQWQESSLESQS
ncbi:hypothetical protein QBC38DRAFT_425299 [Podospora fimiseda]|uniref:F-box domain-containing protein n=1 Tax=Podospora fimiseda TaxID=252190 RepID=A0AAN7BHG1_9PEZI|nr:hypothetical protein QBC38DRAFT_425299 [Podospora fimiseda]